MKSFALLTAVLGVVSAAPSSRVVRAANKKFSIARPGGIKDIIITKDNTLNGTYVDSNTTTISRVKIQADIGQLPLEFVNNFGGGQVRAYITGLDSDNRVVFVRGDGSLVYPSSGGSTVPVPINDNVAINLPGQGQTFRMVLPITMSSGRIYFAEGNLNFYMVLAGDGRDGLVQPSVTNLADPSAGTNWGFVELTYTTDKALFANISYVDFVGFILSMALSTKDGSGSQVTKGLDSSAVSAICNGLVDQSNKDGRAWSSMCIANGSGQPIRVLSPNDYAVINPSDFENYWQGYVDQVWSQYGSQPLTINTQSSPGSVNCQVNGDQMTCGGGDNRGYAKPTARDIWGCDSGPFGKQGGDNDVHLAVIPRLCAAFVRSTLLLQGGNVQPSLGASNYYTVDPTNHYSRLVHNHEVDGKGYAFAYDDVNPDGNENASGVVASGQPDTLTVYFGAPPA